MVCIFAILWTGSELYVTRVQTAYLRGYSDGLRAKNNDGQCASWLMQTDLKDAKRRICK